MMRAVMIDSLISKKPCLTSSRCYGSNSSGPNYTKRPGRPAELDSPYTIPLGGTVDDLALRVHREMAEHLKFAKVWGTSARDGQSVGRDHALADKDVVELHW